VKLDEFLFKTGKDYFYIMHLSYNGHEKIRLWNYAKEKKLIGLDVPGIVTNDWSKIHELARRLAIQQNSAMTWVLRLMLALPSALAIMQLGTLISLSIWQPPLWILPIFVFVWVLVITFIFKDFI